jgi:hypothetical protein
MNHLVGSPSLASLNADQLMGIMENTILLYTIKHDTFLLSDALEWSKKNHFCLILARVYREEPWLITDISIPTKLSIEFSLLIFESSFTNELTALVQSSSFITH